MTRTRLPAESPPLGSPARLEPPSTDGAPEAVLSAQQGYAGMRAEEQEFETIVVRRHQRMLHAYARACVRSVPDAEDLVQEVLSSAWNNHVIARCDGDDTRIRAYLLKAMHNGVVDELRRRHRVREVVARYAASLLTSMTDPESPFGYAVSRDIDRHVARLLRKLPPRCRESFIMIHRLRLPYADAAEALHMNVNTLRAQLRKANRFLRQELAAIGYYSGPDAQGDEMEDTP